MARSYFSRLATPARQATMAPHRPITTLWKAAWFDRMSGAAVAPVRDSGSLMERLLAGEISRPTTSVELEPARQGAASRSARVKAGAPPRPVAQSRMEGTAPSSSVQQPGDVLHRREQPRLEVVRESFGRIDVRTQTRFTPRIEEIFAREAQPFAQRDPDSRRTAAVGERFMLPTENAHAAARPRRTEPSLHIGKIEVQVAPSRPVRQTLPAKPRSRLARDYTLGTNWHLQ